VACTVDNSSGLPGSGTFQLQQGIQRRLAVTLVHDDDPDLAWTDIRELVVGRVRNTATAATHDHGTTPQGRTHHQRDVFEQTVLSLNLLPSAYTELPDDDRYSMSASASVSVKGGKGTECRVPDSLVAEWLTCWSQAQKGLGSHRSRDAVGFLMSI